MFPKDFHGQTQWVGLPLQRGISIAFSTQYLGGVTDFRLFQAVLVTRAGRFCLQDRATTVNVEELGGYQGDDPWARADLQRQTKAIAGKIVRFHLIKQGNGFELWGYYGDREPADLKWVYVPQLEQPHSDELLGSCCCTQPTPIADISEYQVPIYRSGFQPEAAAA